jgi:LmbE family N-acetylglucosaminyl deacetylase
MTRHHDHVRAGEAATEAFHRARSDPASAGAFHHLYYVALRRSSMSKLYRAVAERHLPFGDERAPFNPVGVPDERITVDVDVTDVYERKLDAIRCHRSQIGELERIPRDLQPLQLGHECFVQAWPPWEPGSPVRTDLFDATDPEAR